MDVKQPNRRSGQRPNGVGFGNPRISTPVRNIPREATPQPAPQKIKPTPQVSTASPATPLTSERAAQTLPKKDKKVLPTKRRFVLIGAGVVLLIAVALFINSTKPSNSRSQVGSATEPEFSTVLPSGSTIEQYGGWKRVSPASKEPVFAYTDILDAVTISVSQQPLPSDFKTETEGKIEDLAKKFNATKKLVAGNTTFYVGISAKGPQSVILTKNNLLILIKSEKEISDESWKRYVDSLSV